VNTGEEEDLVQKKFNAIKDKLYRRLEELEVEEEAQEIKPNDESLREAATLTIDDDLERKELLALKTGKFVDRKELMSRKLQSLMSSPSRSFLGNLFLKHP
jgi:hypothetical protein